MLLQLDYTSFSNIWYWVILLIIWAYATHQIAGVPFYQLHFAKRENDAELQTELTQICQLNANRVQQFFAPKASILFALVCGFAFGFWAYAGFSTRHELVQASFLLVFPNFLVLLLRWRTLRTISQRTPDFAQLYRIIWWHRFWVMVAGAFVLFGITIWGVLFELTMLL